jgi:Bacterioferritin-associated ferredoxin
MIVCLCAGISDREVRTAASTGVRHCGEIFRGKERSPRCGSCLETIRALLGEYDGKDAAPAGSLASPA